MSEKESFTTVSTENMRLIEEEVVQYSTHDLKIMQQRTTMEINEYKTELEENEEIIFNLERSIEKTKCELEKLKEQFTDETCDKEENEENYTISIRKNMLIKEAIKENNSVVQEKTKYVVEKCVPYLLTHAAKSQNITINSFDDMIYDEIIAKAHKLHLNRLFKECKPSSRYKKLKKWYEGKRSEIVFAVETNTEYCNAKRRFGIDSSKKRCLSYDGYFTVDFPLNNIRVMN